MEMGSPAEVPPTGKSRGVPPETRLAGAESLAGSGFEKLRSRSLGSSISEHAALGPEAAADANGRQLRAGL